MSLVVWVREMLKECPFKATFLQRETELTFQIHNLLATRNLWLVWLDHFTMVDQECLKEKDFINLRSAKYRSRKHNIYKIFVWHYNHNPIQWNCICLAPLLVIQPQLQNQWSLFPCLYFYLCWTPEPYAWHFYLISTSYKYHLKTQCCFPRASARTSFGFSTNSRCLTTCLWSPADFFCTVHHMCEGYFTSLKTFYK